MKLTLCRNAFGIVFYPTILFYAYLPQLLGLSIVVEGEFVEFQELVCLT